MSETIENVLRDVRKKGKYNKENSDIDWTTEEVGDLMLSLADRFEAAVKYQFRDVTKKEEVAVAENATTTPTCDKSSQVGNAAAMYEALKTISKALKTISKCDISKEEDCYTIYRVCESALATPPRNCDIMDWRTALAKWRTELHTQKPCGYAEVVSGTETDQFMDWYMSEAKGVNK